MNPLKEIFESGQTILWIETQNTVAFLRPVPDILVWTPCPAACVTQPLRFRQVRFTGPEGLLGSLAISDVDYSSCEFDEIARGAENRMTNAVNVPDGATRMHNAIIQFFVGIFMLGPVGRFPERRLIVGMNSLDEFFGSGRTIPWVKTQNAVAFLRPIPDVGVGTPGPTAGFAQPLRFGQISFAAPDSFFCPLAFGDIHCSADNFDILPVLLDAVSNHVQVFHRAVRHEHPRVEINLFSFRCPDNGLFPHLNVSGWTR